MMTSELQKALDYFQDYIERSQQFLESDAVWDERTKNIVRTELKHYQVMMDFVEGVLCDGNDANWYELVYAR